MTHFTTKAGVSTSIGLRALTAKIIEHHLVSLASNTQHLAVRVGVIRESESCGRVVEGSAHARFRKFIYRGDIDPGVAEAFDQPLNDVHSGGVPCRSDALGNLTFFNFGRFNHSIRSLVSIIESFGNSTLSWLAKGRPAGRLIYTAEADTCPESAAASSAFRSG